MTVFTIGHSTRSLDAFIAALREAGVDCVADVRRFPHSRRQPQFNTEALAETLPEAGIAYHHLPALGGRRPARRDGQPSPNRLWREPGFRNYADYAETDAFRAGFAELLDLARQGSPAVLCAEMLWWQCHRRIIADYLLAAGLPVEHIFDANKREPARQTAGAVPGGDGVIRYPGEQLSLL